MRRQLAAAQPVILLGQNHDRAPLGSLIGQRRELCSVRHFGFAYTRCGKKSRCLPIAESDRPRLIEQQSVHVAGSLHRSSRHGKHVVLDQSVHAGDADGGQQAANGRRDEAHQQRNQHEHRLRRTRVNRERLQGHDSQQKDDGQTGQQNIQRNLVGCLLALGAFDQRNHAIEEGLAGIRRYLHLDLVGEHTGSAGHRGAVAPSLTNDGSGFAGDRRLVHRSDPFDDLSVGRDHLAGGHDNHVTSTQLRTRHLLDLAAFQKSVGDRLGAGFPQACRPGPCRGLPPWLRQSWRTAP